MLSSAIKMGARTYAVVCLSDDDFDTLLAQKRVYDSEVKSFIDYDEQFVAVRQRLLPDHRRELVIHELIHAAAMDAGIVQDDRSEEIIAALAPRLNGMLLSGLNAVLRETCA